MVTEEFPIPKSISYEVVKKAHTRILDIAKEVREVLEHHFIPYSLFFGSVIGAVRHKGFIPWDMDMDFGLFENYRKTVEILKKELPSWLVVLDNNEDSNYCASWVKIVDRFSEYHATTFKGDNLFKFKGLHIDLYNIKRTTINEVSRYRLEEEKAYYLRKAQSGLLSSDEYDDLIIKAYQRYEAELSMRTPAEPDKTIYAFLRFFEGEPDTIFPLKRYIFENEPFWGPNNYDQFLKGCYYKGNYMELPPYEERDMKMDSIIVNPIIITK